MPVDFQSLKTNVLFGLLRTYGFSQQLSLNLKHAFLTSAAYLKDGGYYWYYAHWSGDLNSYINSSFQPRTVDFLKTLCTYLTDTAVSLREGAVGTTRLANADIRETESLLFAKRLEEITQFQGEPQALLDLLVKSLSQAKELLETYLDHTHMAANYIPVPPHIQSLNALQALYNDCDRILTYSFGTPHASKQTIPTVLSSRFLQTLTAMEILTLNHAPVLTDNADLHHLISAHLTLPLSEADQDNLDPIIHEKGIYCHFPKDAQVQTEEQALAEALKAAANETDRKVCLKSAAEKLKNLYKMA